MDVKNITVGVEYHISSVVSSPESGLLFQGVVLDKRYDGVNIKVTKYTISEEINVGSVMRFPSSRLLRPVASTNQGFACLLSKED